MPVSATATASGRTGPGSAFSSLALANVQSLTLDFARAVGRIEFLAVGGKPRTLDFDLVLTTTLTDTISSLVNTLVISGS